MCSAPENASNQSLIGKYSLSFFLISCRVWAGNLLSRFICAVLKGPEQPQIAQNGAASSVVYHFLSTQTQTSLFLSLECYQVKKKRVISGDGQSLSKWLCSYKVLTCSCCMWVCTLQRGIRNEELVFPLLVLVKLHPRVPLQLETSNEQHLSFINDWEAKSSQLTQLERIFTSHFQLFNCTCLFTFIQLEKCC